MNYEFQILDVELNILIRTGRLLVRIVNRGFLHHQKSNGVYLLAKNTSQ